MVQVDKDGYGVGFATMGRHSLDKDKLKKIATWGIFLCRDMPDFTISCEQIMERVREEHPELSQAELDFIERDVRGE